MATFNPCYYQSGLNRYIAESDEQQLYKDSGVERQGRGAKTYTLLLGACGAEDGSQGQVRARRARSPWIAPISHRALKVRNKQGVLVALTELSRFLHRPGATLRSPLATLD